MSLPRDDYRIRRGIPADIRAAFEVSMLATVALERRYQIGSAPNLVMSSREFGQFDRFIAFAPATVL